MVTSGGHSGLLELQPRALADQGMPIGMPYAALCLTSLPRREIAAGERWARQFGQASLSLEPGALHVQGADGRTERRSHGLPFGARARLLMLYFWREVRRTGCRELERSMSYRQYLGSLGISPGGKSYRGLREQALRIVGCRMIVAFRYGPMSGVFEDCLVEGGTVVVDDDGQHRYNTMLLSQRLFESMSDTPMAMLDTVIDRIGNQPFAIDIYCWLAMILPAVETETLFSWHGLHGYFGAGYRELRHFRLRMTDTLQRLAGLYPEARFRIDPGAGVFLYRSPSPAATLRPPACIRPIPPHESC